MSEAPRPMFFVLAHDEARRRAMRGCEIAPPGWVVRVSPPNKSRDQEAKYHAQIGDIAAQVLLHGQRFDAEMWKRMLVDAFHYDTKDDPELAEDWRRMGDVRFAPALNHPGVVVLGFQTRDFPKRLASAFIEWLYAFGAENGVEWKSHYREAA